MTDNLTPREVYRFEYTHEDAIMALRRQRKPNVRAFVVSVLLAAVFFFVYMSESYAIPVALAVLVFVALPQLIVLSRHKKAWEKTYNRLRETSIDYKIFDDHLIMLLYRRGEIMGTSKVFLCDISKVQTEGEYVIITISNQFYTLRRCDVPNTSILFRPLHLIPAPAVYVPPETTESEAAPMPAEFPEQEDISPAPAPTPAPVPPPAPVPVPTPEVKPVSRKLKTFSWILFIGSFVALVIAGNISSWYELNILIPVFAVLALIPIASLVVGIIMNKQGSSGGKNIIAGIIISVILVLLILANLAADSIFADDYYDPDDYNDPTPIYTAEELFNIDIPEYEYVDTYESGADLNSTFVYYSSYVQFSEYDADMFMLKVPNDSRWLHSVPTALIGISSPYERTYSSPESYTLIYNIDTGEYNKLPDEDGTYRFMSLIFEPQQDSLTIIEYDIDYVVYKK